MLKLDSVRLAALAGASVLLGLAAASPASAAADLAAAQAIIDQHSTMPEFVPPGPPFDAKACMAGKKILSIPVSSSIPFVDGIESSMEAVAKEVGFEFQQWKNQGQPTQWVQGMEFGINNGFDAIDLMGGIIPSSLGPQAAAAQAPGVQVLASHYADTTQPRDPAAEVNLALPFNQVGKILAAWVTVKTGGNANVLIIGSDDVLPSDPYRKTMQSTLAELCPECKSTYVNVPIADWSTKIQTTVQSSLIADPTINYVVPLYDSMSQFVLPALTITGKKGEVKIASFNGTPFIIDMVQKGDVEMDVGESLGWIARSTLDGYMRKLCGLPTYDTLNVPLYIFDEKNAKDAGVPADFDKGYGDKHVDGFAKLWGLK